MKGYVKLHRKLIDSPIWRSKNHKIGKLAIHCLLRANHKAANLIIDGSIVEISPGQFWTSLGSLENETGISKSSLETGLKALQKVEFLRSKGGRSGRLITIINWSTYQVLENGNEKQNEKLIRSKSEANKKLIRTNKNEKNEKNEKNKRIEDSALTGGPDKSAPESGTRGAFIGKLKSSIKKIYGHDLDQAVPLRGPLRAEFVERLHRPVVRRQRGFREFADHPGSEIQHMNRQSVGTTQSGPPDFKYIKCSLKTVPCNRFHVFHQPDVIIVHDAVERDRANFMILQDLHSLGSR